MKASRGFLRLWLAAALAVGTSQIVHADDSLEQIKKAGTINVGIAQEPPYAFITPEGKVTGASIDLNRAVFAKMGLGELKAETTDFAGLIPGVQARRFDIISTGLIIRPARCEAVLFSQPDLCTGEGFAVKKGNPLGLKSYEDVKAGKARYLGASSMWAWQFAKLQHAADLGGWTRFVTMQDQYSLMMREEEREMFPLLADQGVGSLPWSPLAKGRLTRPWGEQTLRGETDPLQARYTEEHDRPIAEAVRRVAEARSVPMAQIALAWVLRNPVVDAPIVGATKPHHLPDAVAAVHLELTDDEARQLEAPYTVTLPTGY